MSVARCRICGKDELSEKLIWDESRPRHEKCGKPSKAEKAIKALEAEFGGVPECKNCLNFERIIKDPVTKEEYVKCKSPFTYLAPKKDAYRCYYFANKSQRIRDNIARMIEEGEELERKLRPTLEDMNRPFTI